MILLGDWGGIPYKPYFTPFEFITADQLMTYSNAQNVDMVLALGDNFYFDGVENEFDKRFQVSMQTEDCSLFCVFINYYILTGRDL